MLRSGAVCAITLSALLVCASAKPVTYTGFVVTNGRLGTWSFQHARVYLTFQGDTSNVKFIQPPDPNGGTIDAYINSVGTATVTVISGSKVVHATFAPNQIFVSLDLGQTADAPHKGGRGVGFGSFSATAPGGIEPAYPLGIEEGTLHWGEIYFLLPSTATASSEVQALSTDLKHGTGFSGEAISCVGFPNPCGPPNVLHTDLGDLYLNFPYRLAKTYISLNSGFFLAKLAQAPTYPALVKTPASPKPMTYHGYVISDVWLGSQHYKAAQVYLSFQADASTVTSFSNGSSYGYMNTVGTGGVTIISGATVVSATFNPGQIYVYYDLGHASIGFGSAAGTGYPLSFTAKSDTSLDTDLAGGYLGALGNSTVVAATDLTVTPPDATRYTPQTATLATHLTNNTALSSAASSCVAFDPATSYCSNLTPTPLKTSKGDFYLFEPYTVDELGDGTTIFSINWGVFWSVTGAAAN